MAGMFGNIDQKVDEMTTAIMGLQTTIANLSAVTQRQTEVMKELIAEMKACGEQSKINPNV